MNTPGFRRKMRLLIHEADVSYQAKAEMFWLLSRIGPDAAWKEYKRQMEEEEHGGVSKRNEDKGVPYFNDGGHIQPKGSCDKRCALPG